MINNICKKRIDNINQRRNKTIVEIPVSVFARITVKYSLHLIVASIDQSLVTTVFHRTFARCYWKWRNWQISRVIKLDRVADLIALVTVPFRQMPCNPPPFLFFSFLSFLLSAKRKRSLKQRRSLG